jgi:hypothetical protein
MPTNNFGQVYNNGVKYIKINRFDSGGLDRTDYLQQLQSLRINYDDLGPIEYNIITIQEQNDYYVYGIQPKVQSTSSVNFEVLDYSFLATSASSFTNIPDSEDANWGDIKIGSFGTVIGNSLGYLNISNAKYALGNTPNVYFQVQFSGSYTLVGSNTDLVIGVGEENTAIFNPGEAYVNLPVTTGTNTFNKTITLSGSANLIENNNIVFGIGTYLGATVNITFNSLHVSLSLFSASINPATSSLTIFNPDFLDFEYNDYNALFGNAEQPQYSSRYMDVDYSSNPLTPVNFNLIISGTADKAQVQDSNYESSTWSNIRYDGSRYSSFDFNQPTAYQINNNKSVPLTLENYIQDSNYNLGYTSGVPSVEQNKTYFAYFDGVGGTGPEIIGQTAYFIKWVIDENGDAVNPEPDTIALLNLVDSFEPGKNALVRLTATDPLASSNPNDSALTGLHPITHVGRIATMLVTQTGSGQMDYIRSMSFNYMNGNPIAQATANVSSWWYSSINSSFISNASSWDTFNFNVTGYQNGWGNPSSGVYKMVQSGGTLGANTRVKLQIRFNLRRPQNSSLNAFTVRLVKNGNVLQTFPPIYVSSYTPTAFTSETDWLDINENDEFEIQYQVGTGGTGFQIEILGAGAGVYTELRTIQENPLTSGFINGITGVTSSYWSVGTYLTGSNVSVLTASQALNSLYSIGVIQSSPTSSLAFGFSSCSIAFDPQPGDYIRFQYDKNRVHNITNVSTFSISGSNQSSSLFLTVVPPIATSSILDNFVLYRIVNDGSYVVLDVDKKPGGNSFGGIIQPQYVSKTVTDGYNNIIQNLIQKGLIS